MPYQQLPKQVLKSISIALDPHTLQIRSGVFAAQTPGGDSVLVRRVEGLTLLDFDIHDTPGPSTPEEKGLVAQAPEAMYNQLLSEALDHCQITLCYFELI